MKMKQGIERIKELVVFLNKCCDEYYNKNAPSLSDAEYDSLFDELKALEEEYGFVLAESPTQRPGYEVISKLEKVTHDIPLLSLDKTKDEADIQKMAQASDGYVGLKIDGLTVKLVYERGVLSQASTRGDGEVGEDITHNAKVFVNVPVKISRNERLVVTGEAYIDIDTFDSINERIENDEDKYATPRNLASGSVRQLDSKICSERGVRFMPFSVLSGLEDIPSKTERLKVLCQFGFDSLPRKDITKDDTTQTIHDKIFELKDYATEHGLPIDGAVFTYDDAAFSQAQGRTSHHYKDGIAYKFGDPQFETVLSEITWNISRTGQLTPIAVFEPVEIDNTVVERASLHNMTFINNLKLLPKDKILVSKRNMIIPHVEKNLTASAENREEFTLSYPDVCPICGEPTKVRQTNTAQDLVETLYCENNDCAGKQVKKYAHFVSKPAMNVDGLSEATLEKFIQMGWIRSLRDLYRLEEHAPEIIEMQGFGEKSWQNLSQSLENSKTVSLANFLVALNIPLLGKNAALLLQRHVGGDVQELIEKIDSGYDFAEIDGFGEIINIEIHKWFSNPENRAEFDELLPLMQFTAPQTQEEDSEFSGKTVVITGTFSKYTRDELTAKMQSMGAKVTGSVSKKTDYLLCGENAGSKLAKAKSLGVTVITEAELTV